MKPSRGSGVYYGQRRTKNQEIYRAQRQQTELHNFSPENLERLLGEC
ncbi:MAG: hypothetical protein ACFB2W_12325 [Leptolyngbyaceae cyanobacterium]